MLLPLTYHVAPVVAEDSEVWCSPALNMSVTPTGEPISELELYELTYATYKIQVYVAVDEEFMQINYWVPWNVNGLGWLEAAKNIVERGDNYLFETFKANVQIIGWLSWQSNNELSDNAARLHELADDLAWGTNTKSVLVGFTGQSMYDGQDEVAGASFNQKVNQTKALLIHPQAYWADDNLFQHELSHILGLEDHKSLYPETLPNCIMSYKTVYIGIWTEDGWAWTILSNVMLTYVTHQYDGECKSTILSTLGNHYKNNNEHPTWVGGGRNFPV
jgi:hypothetical protein